MNNIIPPPKRENSRFHTIQILTEFDRENPRLSRLFSDYFSSHSLPKSERMTITHLVQETTRWRGYLDHVLSTLYNRQYKKVEYRLKNILRLGCYELIFRERTPSYAIVNSAVNLAKGLVNRKAGGLVNSILRQIDSTYQPDIDTLSGESSVEEISLLTSHPSWMIDRWLRHFGFSNTIDLCQWNNSIPQFTIRRSQLRIDSETLEKFLTHSEIDWKKCEFDSNFYFVNRIVHLRNSDEFKAGCFSFQDISGGIVTNLIEGQKGDYILDVCAAPGGKSTYLAERFGNNITIHSYDVNEDRLEKIKENVKRLRLHNITVEKKDATRDHYPPANTILIDAPCTGTGVMAKRADLRWRRRKEDIREMQQLQLDILNNVTLSIQTGNEIIYTTCSLEPEENWGVIKKFLHHNDDLYIFPLETRIDSNFIDNHSAICTFPPRDNMDGVFAVKLIKQ